MIHISEVTPSVDKAEPGKNKTVGLNYAGPGMNHSHTVLRSHWSSSNDVLL